MTLTTTDLRKICDALKHDHERKLFVTQAAFRNAATPSRVRAMLDEIDALTARAEAAEALVKEAGEALGACIDTLALTEQIPFEDPVYGEDVRHLGSCIGYGALMSSASASWANIATAKGLAGSQFVAGPCHVTVVRTLCAARAFLAKMEKNDEL